MATKSPKSPFKAPAQPAAAEPVEPVEPVFPDLDAFAADDADDADEDQEEEGFSVGDLVSVRDAEGNVTRIGLVIGEGAEPNLNHKDEFGNAKPETRQPVIAWLALDGAPSPYGLELSPLDA